jgi:hypothetical protein
MSSANYRKRDRISYRISDPISDRKTIAIRAEQNRAAKKTPARREDLLWFCADSAGAAVRRPRGALL